MVALLLKCDLDALWVGQGWTIGRFVYIAWILRI